MRITIEKDLTRIGKTLNNKRHSRAYYPLLNGIITNPKNNKTNAPSTETFLIDTGASISLLHPRNQYLFDRKDAVDTTNIQFGISSIKCNVYEVDVMFLGHTLSIYAALIPKMSFSHSVIGYFEGLDKMDIFVMNMRQKKFKLINRA